VFDRNRVLAYWLVVGGKGSYHEQLRQYLNQEEVGEAEAQGKQGKSGKSEKQSGKSEKQSGKPETKVTKSRKTQESAVINNVSNNVSDGINQASAQIAELEDRRLNDATRLDGLFKDKCNKDNQEIFWSNSLIRSLW
jgi:hypothetical protein